MADVPPKNPTRITGAFRFTAAVGDTGESSASRKGATFAASMVFHSIIAVTIVIVPILASDMMPTPSDSVLKAFFVQPGEMAPPPPPPPPPAPGPRPTIKTQAPPTPADAAFVAPIETPAEIKPEQNLDFSFGVEGGVAGGVEGGVPGGVVGGIVGGMPNEGPPPPRQLVRVGGNVKTPKKIKTVSPVYPELAKASRLSATIILEAEVDARGVVTAVKILRGHPLFDQAVEEAVKQWRYQPLLLNGEPTAFVVTVTFPFTLTNAGG